MCEQAPELAQALKDASDEAACAGHLSAGGGWEPPVCTVYVLCMLAVALPEIELRSVWHGEVWIEMSLLQGGLS